MIWLRHLPVSFVCLACSSAPGSLRAPLPVTTSMSEPGAPDAQAFRADTDAAIALAEGTPNLHDAAVDAGPDRSSQERLIRAVASGETPIVEAIDPEFGVVSIRYLSPPQHTPGRPGVRAISSSHRHCGAALVRALPSLERDLAAVVRSVDAGRPFQCEGDRCVVRGEGASPAWYLRFRDSDDSAPRLEIVAQVSENAVGEAWIARSRAYVDRAQATGGNRPCTMECLSRAREVPSGIDCVVSLMGGLDAAVRAYGYLGLAELATSSTGDVAQTMEAYIRRYPSSPLAAGWRTYLQGR